MTILTPCVIFLIVIDKNLRVTITIKGFVCILKIKVSLVTHYICMDIIGQGMRSILHAFLSSPSIIIRPSELGLYFLEVLEHTVA